MYGMNRMSSKEKYGLWITLQSFILVSIVYLTLVSVCLHLMGDKWSLLAFANVILLGYWGIPDADCFLNGWGFIWKVRNLAPSLGAVWIYYLALITLGIYLFWQTTFLNGFFNQEEFCSVGWLNVDDLNINRKYRMRNNGRFVKIRI